MMSIEELVQSARDNLANHISANSPTHDGRWIRFFIELAIPLHHQSTVCRHPLCGEKTKSYRISVHPGYISAQRSSNSRADYYHFECFDELVNLTKPTHIDAFQPLTRTMCANSSASEKSILDFGAYRLVQEWKLQVKRIARPNLPILSWLNPKRIDLLYNGGSARYKLPKKNTNPSLYASFSTVAAAVESDGPNDVDEWSFFNHYFPPSLGVLPPLASVSVLGEVLSRWDWDKTIVSSSRGHAEKQIASLNLLSPKARRGIARLSAIPARNVL